ncbi:hypothetical protein OJ258_001244 [Listeria monocytogenes]|uniref:hypothetical protein n=1 Tax=Listeria monocytogenes TaxID=1639 RepID=UPI00074D60FE|nr:hypothetical protein [Listeria monocytogenes]EHC6037497.1 hypothetical protein [Listeria monocytogenes serotype 1/2a]EAA0404671.1 hypothetical protein [Listeria monocytogenes]EAC2331161.1 hypothetical protein [Listeria monocytogenes]EAC2620524.1 hypothetical protein [Listeria monocytogenes]EAC2698788.1 hypothetical protein [Listeria monocytogenes]
MKSRNWLKGLGVTMIAATLILTGCGNGDAEKTDTKEQTKSVEEEGKKVKIESNEGKPQHEQLITVKLPPEADYLNDETLDMYEKDLKKFNNTTQLIIDNSITLLIGDYCYYNPTVNKLECSAVVVNGTNTTIKDINFEVNVKLKNQTDMTFIDNGMYSFIKNEVGEIKPNEGFPTGIAFLTDPSEKNGEDMIKINTNDVVIQLKNIDYTVIK